MKGVNGSFFPPCEILTGIKESGPPQILRFSQFIASIYIREENFYCVGIINHKRLLKIFFFKFHSLYTNVYLFQPRPV